MTYSDHQLTLLKRMGIDVWVSRDQQESFSEEEYTASLASDHHENADTVDEAEPITHQPPIKGESSIPAARGELKTAQEVMASLEEAVRLCQKCSLCSSRSNTVFGAGQIPATWMFVGEAPGQNEDQQGLPFVGRAGKLLDLMLRALGVERKSVYISNVLKCRPPGNRDPLPEEVEQCEPYLLSQLEQIQPQVIVALGRISAQALLKTSEPLGRLRGRVHHYGASQIPLIATYHPAYLLRSPEQKSRSWDDLWLAKTLVDQG